jgi:hypothetical protein
MMNDKLLIFRLSINRYPLMVSFVLETLVGFRFDLKVYWRKPHSEEVTL